MSLTIPGLLFGTIEEQSGLLRRYAAEVLQTNPGSTMITALHEQVFRGIYICFNVYKAGFKLGCRKVVDVDGAICMAILGELC